MLITYAYLFSCPIECVYNFFSGVPIFSWYAIFLNSYCYEGKKSAYNVLIRAMVIPMQLATKIEQFCQFG